MGISESSHEFPLNNQPVFVPAMEFLKQLLNIYYTGIKYHQ